jgi:hypothetical protein
MSKDTVHQCIDENIVSNGKRGITAQSLANTLHLLADEGGGAGAMMVKVGTLIPGEGDIITTVLTAEERAHNVEIFNAIKEAAANGEAMPVITFDILALVKSLDPEIALLTDGCSFQMSSMVTGYMTGPIMAELTGELGYSEIVMTISLVGVFIILIAPDGTILLSGDLS